MVYYILVFSGRETYRLSRSKRLLLSSSWFKYKIIVFLIPLYCVLLVICFCNFNYEWVVIGLSWTQVMMGPWISPNPDLIRLSVHAGLNCVYNIILEIDGIQLIPYVLISMGNVSRWTCLIHLRAWKSLWE